jgi:hypothetical protein
MDGAMGAASKAARISLQGRIFTGNAKENAATGAAFGFPA